MVKKYISFIQMGYLNVKLNQIPYFYNGAITFHEILLKSHFRWHIIPLSHSAKFN